AARSHQPAMLPSTFSGSPRNPFMLTAATRNVFMVFPLRFALAQNQPTTKLPYVAFERLQDRGILNDFNQRAEVRCFSRSFSLRRSDRLLMIRLSQEQEGIPHLRITV